MEQWNPCIEFQKLAIHLITKITQNLMINMLHKTKKRIWSLSMRLVCWKID